MTDEEFQETYRINHIYKTEGFKVKLDSDAK